MRRVIIEIWTILIGLLFGATFYFAFDVKPGLIAIGIGGCVLIVRAYFKVGRLLWLQWMFGILLIGLAVYAHFNYPV